MKFALATVLILAFIPLHAADDGRAFVGTVRKVSKDHIDLDYGTSVLVIGFTLDANVVPALERIEIGQEVRAVFGSAQSADGRRINRLLSIRVCGAEDAQCAADRARQDREGEELDRQLAESGLRHKRCLQAMQETLAGDDRYVPESAQVSGEFLNEFNALSGERQSCASEVLKQHSRAILEACELHHCGDNVGGGCSHIAGYARTRAAYQRAVEKCGG